MSFILRHENKERWQAFLNLVALAEKSRKSTMRVHTILANHASSIPNSTIVECEEELRECDAQMEKTQKLLDKEYTFFFGSCLPGKIPVGPDLN